MTPEQHILCWIESSQPHYRRLLKLSVPGNFIGYRDRAQRALNLAADAQREMIRDGDAHRSEHDEIVMLRAAAMLCEWRLEE